MRDRLPLRRAPGTTREREIARPPLRLVRASDDVRNAAQQPTGSEPTGSRFRGGLSGGALQRVRAYIDDHIGERISLAALARQAGSSRFHFARQFRLSTGVSPMEYLRRVRIERSKRILQTQETSIAEIAAILGFADQSHFTRIFRRLVGVPPRSFARCDDWTPTTEANGG